MIRFVNNSQRGIIKKTNATIQGDYSMLFNKLLINDFEAKKVDFNSNMNSEKYVKISNARSNKFVLNKKDAEELAKSAHITWAEYMVGNTKVKVISMVDVVKEKTIIESFDGTLIEDLLKSARFKTNEINGEYIDEHKLLESARLNPQNTHSQETHFGKTNDEFVEFLGEGGA